MEPDRDQIKLWLKEILAESGETATSWAKRAGIAQSTLTRFLNSDEAPMIGMRSLSKLAHAARRSLPIGPSPSTNARLPVSPFSDRDGEPYKPGDHEARLARAISALIGGRTACDAWELKTRALEAVGYWSGDIVIVDLHAKPVPGSIVCAQHFNWTRNATETVFRVYEPPYLVAATLDPALAAQLRKPLLVDNDHVLIKGVVTDAIRQAANSD